MMFLSFSALASTYPEEWWRPVSRIGAPAWEILPQEAAPGEVILSKRTELGILSNFAVTPFQFRGKTYASVEGFWQMMKFPENSEDPRFGKLPFTRDEVSQMVAFEAKNAGNLGSQIMKDLGIDWVSFEGQRFTYCSPNPGEHFALIKVAMQAKLLQNLEVRRILKATGNLILKPDHYGDSCLAQEWKYAELWMELRESIK